MKNYYMCDIHFHTNNSFDAFKKNKFDIKNLYDILKGSDVTSKRMPHYWKK